MFGQYAGFIIPAYVLSAVVIIGLIVQVNLAYRARPKERARLEDQGLVSGVRQVPRPGGSLRRDGEVEQETVFSRVPSAQSTRGSLIPKGVEKKSCLAGKRKREGRTKKR